MFANLDVYAEAYGRSAAARLNDDWDIYPNLTIILLYSIEPWITIFPEYEIIFFMIVFVPTSNQ